MNKLQGLPLAIFDFETTGPDPQTCAPLQVAVYHMCLGDASSITCALKTLIHFEGEIPADATAVHGITSEMVQGAPPVEAVLDEMWDLFEDRVLCAYNLPYDWQVAQRYLEYTPGGRVLPFPGLDPSVWWRKITNGFSGKLTAVAAHYKVDMGNAHDAGCDTLATAKIIPHLLQDLVQQRAIPSHVDAHGLLTAQSTWAQNQEIRINAWLRRSGRQPGPGWSACVARGVPFSLAE